VIKWIGQHIVSLVARFRSDIYLENLTATNETSVLVVDNVGKISKRLTIGGGDMTGVDLTGGNAISVTSEANTASGAYSATISHDDTSSQASVNNSGSTYIQDLEVDTYGHVTGLTSAAIPTLNQNTTGSAGTVTAGTQAAITTCANLVTVGTIGTGEWRATAITSTYIADDAVTEDKLANALLAEIDANTAKVTNSDQSKADINALDITELGTISSGVWNGTAIASANLDADTMHYSAQRQLTHHTIQDDIDTQVVFLSLAEFDGENTAIGNNKLPLIAPVAGKLLKVFVRCSHNLSGVDFTWKLYTRTSSQSTNGNAAEIGAQTGTGPTNGNMVTYDFTTGLDSGTNAIGAGDKVQISLETDGSTSNANFFITLMWEWNLS